MWDEDSLAGTIPCHRELKVLKNRHKEQQYERHTLSKQQGANEKCHVAPRKRMFDMGRGSVLIQRYRTISKYRLPLKPSLQVVFNL